jgi:hypothetical protein
MSDPWGNAPQEPQEPQQPGDVPTQSAFPQYPQQYQAAPFADPGYGYPGGDFGHPAAYGPPRNSKLAITSLVLGIVSIPCVVVPVIGPLIALVGLILGIVGIAGASRKNLKRGLGIAGIVLSAVGLIGGSLVTTAELHAAKACQGIPSTDKARYNDCFKHNLKL